MKRTTIIAGNWKMNLSFQEAIQLTQEILTQCPHDTEQNIKIMLFSPFVYAAKIAELCSNRPDVYAGVQNMYYEKAGAYTGEISPLMLKDIGIKATLIGHSERRILFHEDNAMLAKKVKAALEHDIIPVFCIGETLQEREENKTQEVIYAQIQEGLWHLSEQEFSKVILAYEPVWAIGTGKNATPLQAQEVHQYVRACIQARYNYEIAQKIPILYGGSMKPDNAPELLKQPDIDGGLIGGASLKARDFVTIYKAAY